MRHFFACVVMPTVAAVALVAGGCAGRFSGELDGPPVPPFSTAALATFDVGARGGLLRGLALPGDSCEEGAAIVDAARTLSTKNFNDFEAASAPLLALLDASQRDGDWRLELSVLSSTGLDDVDGAVVDLDDFDTDVFVGLTLCRKDGEAQLRNGGFEFDEGVDCFSAQDGDVVLERSDDGSLRIVAEKPLQFFNRNGGEDGELALDVGFSSCAALTTALDLSSPAATCFDSCLVRGGGIVDCVNTCRGGEGEGEGEGEEGEGEGEGEPPSDGEG